MKLLQNRQQVCQAEGTSFHKVTYYFSIFCWKREFHI